MERVFQRELISLCKDISILCCSGLVLQKVPLVHSRRSRAFKYFRFSFSSHSRCVERHCVHLPVGFDKNKTGISHAFLSIIKTEGPRTLYNGLWPTLLGLYRVTCMLMAMASACKLVLKCCVWCFFFSSCINHTVYSSLLFCLIGIVFNRSVFIYLFYHYFMLHVLDYCNKDHDPLQYRWVHASYSLLQHI